MFGADAAKTELLATLPALFQVGAASRAMAGASVTLVRDSRRICRLVRDGRRICEARFAMAGASAAVLTPSVCVSPPWSEPSGCVWWLWRPGECDGR